MKDQSTTTLAGSEKAAPSAAAPGTIDKATVIDVSVRIRRKKELNLTRDITGTLSHEDYTATYGGLQADVDKVNTFGANHGLTVKDADLARRTVTLSGTVANFEDAFDVKLNGATDAAGHTFRAREGAIYIPKSLEGIIVGVFGLDNRPAARPMFQVARKGGQVVSHAQSPQSFTPNQLAGIYGFPAGDGKGETIALIELGGGFRTADIDKYFAGLKLAAPAVKAVLVDGGKNSPTNPNGADGEVMLDIEVAGGVAPGAAIAVYFTTNTDQGFLNAITTAVHDTVNKPSVISISWGSAEIDWTPQAMTNFDDAFQSAGALGVTICVAAGDSGSSDSVTDGKVHVDFPASSPHVLACGGTSLKVSGTQITSEVVWHDSAASAGGGGVSEVVPVPDVQAGAKVPVSVSTGHQGRGVPDVAGNADPDTGYQVIVDGQEMVIGGTSAVAPLMAGLIARINQGNGKSSGFINPLIYANHNFCRDIITGNNKTTKSKQGYTAGPGWDACTGWGVLSRLS